MDDYAVEAVRAINEKVNELLLNYDDRTKNPAIDPSVDIDKIARACGIKNVEYVTPDKLEGKYAIYRNGIVKVDKSQCLGRKRFILAHEVGHSVFQYFITDTIKITDFEIVRKENGDIIIKPFFTEKVSKEAARRGDNSDLSPAEQKIEVFLDRFAANLLVPISRFQLWENRGEDEIAEAFCVDKECIIRRREEIKHELNILTSEMKPCSELEIVDPDVKLDIDSLLKESTIINAN